jgi:chemotaxis protein methyltransferase CheR
MNDSELEEIELDLLCEAISRRWGYDFRDYARASLRRRFRDIMMRRGIKQLSGLIPFILTDEQFFADCLESLSVHVTDMFRDAGFYRALVEFVFPHLATYPFLRVWIAGCATGEEAYSVAILLQEAGLLERCRIYATDFNERVLDVARSGIYPIDKLGLYEANYRAAGGRACFRDYGIEKYAAFAMREGLRAHLTFANHNLVTDGVFCEMQLIICRNVLIYFNGRLQNHVIAKCCESLCDLGFLCLGSRESLRDTETAKLLRPICKPWRIFRKVLSALPSAMHTP